MDGAGAGSSPWALLLLLGRILDGEKEPGVMDGVTKLVCWAQIFGNCGAEKLGRKSHLQQHFLSNSPLSLGSCPAQSIPLSQLAFPGAAFQLQTWKSELQTARLSLKISWELAAVPQLQRGGQHSFLSASCTWTGIFVLVLGMLQLEAEDRDSTGGVQAGFLDTQDSSGGTEGCKSHFRDFPSSRCDVLTSELLGIPFGGGAGSQEGQKHSQR